MNYNRDFRSGLAQPRVSAGLVTTALIALLITLGFAPASAQTAGLAGLPQAPVAPSQSAPKAVVLNPAYDFGTTLNGNTVRHTFKIRNDGEGALIIGGTTTSCGCTAAKPTKEHVAPGQESDIDVSFDTRGEKGSVERIITVFTNDPANPQLRMTLKGDVKQQVAANPQEVSFGIVKHGSELQRTVTIDDLMKDKHFTVGPIANSNHNIAVSEQPRADGQAGAMLK
ncbi:MAG: DUF1573 domain-containing protein, partial [Candidatus Binataceae bacterium]